MERKIPSHCVSSGGVTKCSGVWRISMGDDKKMKQNLNDQYLSKGFIICINTKIPSPFRPLSWDWKWLTRIMPGVRWVELLICLKSDFWCEKKIFHVNHAHFYLKAAPFAMKTWWVKWRHPQKEKNYLTLFLMKNLKIKVKIRGRKKKFQAIGSVTINLAQLEAGGVRGWQKIIGKRGIRAH